MPQPPVFFLAFANNPRRPLPNLEKESKALHRLLSPSAKEQRIHLYREDFAAIDDIAHYLTEHKGSVRLFHYGGHADSRRLFLSDQSANANGIARLLAQQPQLKLVFLNGCATREQVRLLLELGVPAVIATSVLIGDTAATGFAATFYDAVVKDHTIGEAFHMAAAVVETKGGKLPQAHRGFGAPKQGNAPFPWGLYYDDDSILAEKLLPPPPSAAARKKNVLEDADLEVDSNAHIGNKTPAEEGYDEMNVVRRSKIKVKGDFRLGDG